MKTTQQNFSSTRRWKIGVLWVALLLMLGCIDFNSNDAIQTKQSAETDKREEVVFWHFWGGEDRDVVIRIVQQFNESQTRYCVRAIAMPGNNLQAKLFLAVAGKDPPDIVNQDDPVLADWAKRGVIQPMANIASAAEIDFVNQKLLPAARRLSVVDEQLYAVCNGLDIRALIYNETALNDAGLDPPQTIKQLDTIAEHFSPTLKDAEPKRLRAPVGYLPDSRRLWAWGPVFGAKFYNEEDQRLQLDSPPVADALNWMAGYGRRYGADNLAAFRQGDQSLPGKTFPLLPVDDDSTTGRYVVTMDGQWRVRDIAAFQKRRLDLGLPKVRFGVCPLPFVDIDADQQPDPPSRRDAGWVNGNFFVVPSGAKCSAGAWEFARFWTGLGRLNKADDVATWYAKGGWIPVTREVIESETYLHYTSENVLLKEFVRLAGSPNQFPIPTVSGAAMLKREVENLTYDAMHNGGDEKAIHHLLQQRSEELNRQLKAIQDDAP